MSLINSFTHIQENWKFVIICVQNQWGVLHPWHGTVANLWGRHNDFTKINENFEKSYLLNGLSNIVKFFTVWFLKIFCIKWIHIFFWVQCSFIKKSLHLQMIFEDPLLIHILGNFFFYSLLVYVLSFAQLAGKSMGGSGTIVPVLTEQLKTKINTLILRSWVKYRGRQFNSLHCI